MGTVRWSLTFPALLFIRITFLTIRGNYLYQKYPSTSKIFSRPSRERLDHKTHLDCWLFKSWSNYTQENVNKSNLIVEEEEGGLIHIEQFFVRHREETHKQLESPALVLVILTKEKSGDILIWREKEYTILSIWGLYDKHSLASFGTSDTFQAVFI